MRGYPRVVISRKKRSFLLARRQPKFSDHPRYAYRIHTYKRRHVPKKCKLQPQQLPSATVGPLNIHNQLNGNEEIKNVICFLSMSRVHINVYLKHWLKMLLQSRPALFYSMFKMIDGLDNRVDVTDHELKESEVSAEVAKQREHIKRLQSAMEDQSRLLQEISQQLKVGAR